MWIKLPLCILKNLSCCKADLHLSFSHNAECWFYDMAQIFCRYAISIGSVGEYEGMQQKILNGYTYKVR